MADISFVEQEDRRVSIGMRDVLDLIPDFDGGDEIKFVHFQQGCKEALEILGFQWEKILLTFLKLKLKGNAYTRFALHMAKYEELSIFLEDIRAEFRIAEIENPNFWEELMINLYRKKYEPVKEFGARVQDTLQCAITVISPRYTLDTLLGTRMSKEEHINHLENIARGAFEQNINSDRLKAKIAHSHLRNLQDLISIADRLEHKLQHRAKCRICYESDHVDEECTTMKLDSNEDSIEYCPDNELEQIESW